MSSEKAMEAPATTGDSMASIDDAPVAGQSIEHRGTKYTTIKEGLGYILVPHGTPTSTDPKLSKEDSQKQSVFYNPIQQFNRDLSVLAIKAYGEDLMARRKAQLEKKQKKQLAHWKQKQRKAKRDEVGGEGNAQRDHPTDGQNTNEEKAEDEGDLSYGPPMKRRKTDEAGNSIAVAEAPVAPVESADTVAGDAKSDAMEKLSSSRGEVRDGDKVSASEERKIPFKILDALSATGLRALRYAQEIPFSTSITANDMSEKATNSISLNIKYNKLEDKITAHTGNAIAYMYSFVDKSGFDVIDLDPYGTAAPFLDASLQAINDGGLLCVTCTDSAIFASHGYLEKTFSQYGGLPLKGEACHEGGLRLVLHAIASSAARYGLAIEPLLSLSIDYYVRVFVRVRKSPNDVKMHAGKSMIVYNCDSGCGAWSPQFMARHRGKPNKKGETFYKHSFAQAPSTSSNCEHCGQKTHLSGPMYGGPLHNPAFIERIRDYIPTLDAATYPTKDRIDGMLYTAYQEMSFGTKSPTFEYVEKPEEFSVPKMDPATVDEHPFFFILSALSRVIHCSAPPTAALRGALLHAGFKVTMSHCKPGSIKTNANWDQIWHMMREWVRQKAPQKNLPKEGSPGRAIMEKGQSIQAKNPDENLSVAAGPVVTEDTNAAQNGEKEAESRPKADDKPEDSSASGSHGSFEVVFDENLGKDHERGKYVRYQLAPRENWGPMARAK